MAPEAVDRLGAGREVRGTTPPEGVATTVHELATFDGAKVQGVLHRLPGATTVVSLMHPRQSLTHHPMIGYLLRAGVSVWTQDTRSPNNDLNLVHEQALLDVAAGQVFLENAGFGFRLTFGHSGGGTLFAYYIEQAAMPPAERIGSTPAGRSVALAGARMPVPQGAMFLAPHPGQGAVLLNCIDPSVADEADPMSVVPELDMYDPANGFAEPGRSSSYSPDFVQSYRAAQLRRVEQLDAVARERAERTSGARAAFAASSDPRDRRRALAPQILMTYRTDADPRYVDLGLDPSDRPYGSLFGRRPDLTNYGLVGFARLTTPDSWLSTWSGLSSNAHFTRCAPGVHVPTVYVEFSGDQAAYTHDADEMFGLLAATDKSRVRVRGQHFGQPLTPDEPTGYEAATRVFFSWLQDRFELVPVAGRRH